MFGQFCGSTLKIVRLSQIVHIKNEFSVSSWISSEKSNDAITAPNDENTKSNTATHKKPRLSNYQLETFLSKMKAQEVDRNGIFGVLKRCLSSRPDQKRMEIMKDIWKELKRNTNKLPIDYYKYILQFARNQRDVKLAQEIFDEMIDTGLKPDVFAYVTLIAAYCRVGNIEKTMEIVALMEKHGFYINEDIYNEIARCHILRGNIESARETMTNLKLAKFRVDNFTLEALLRHYAKAGDLINIEKTIDLYKKENVTLLNIAVLKVMCELATNGHSSKIEPLFLHLKQTNELRKSLNIAIKIFVENNQSAIVPEILKRTQGIRGEYKHLIQEMVRFSTPEPEFNETIANIEKIGLSVENNFFAIFKPAINGPSEETIRKLLAHMQSQSIGVSENEFKKLFELAVIKGADEVLNVVNLMCTEFRIQPQFTFISDVILPGLKSSENPTLAFAQLRTTDIHTWRVILAIVNDSLNNGNIKNACDFASANQIFLGAKPIEISLLKAFAGSGDVTNFVALVRLIHDSFNRINEYVGDETVSDAEIWEKQNKFIGGILFSAISKCPVDSSLPTQLLESFIEAGLAIHPDHAKKIRNYLGINDQTQIGQLLNRLTQTKSLMVKTDERQRSTPRITNHLSSTNLQNILEERKRAGHDSAATDKLQFMAYIHEGNDSKVESLLSNGQFSIGIKENVLLIDMYTRLGKLDEALKILERISANNPSFKLDRMKVGKLVRLMVEKECDFIDIEALLLDHRPSKAESHNVVFKQILDRLAANGKVDLVEKLFDTLCKYGYIQPTAESTAPIILAYLNEQNFAGAVGKYEYLANTYNMLPLTMVLFIRLIENDQVELLQRVFNTVISVYDESVALCRLAFAFIQCGKDNEARKVLKNDRIRNLSIHLAKECKQYSVFGRIEAAKTLLTATKGLNCDRHVIYQTILDIYEKENKAQEALNLWCDYFMEDDIAPKQQFRKKLVNLLKLNNLEVPSELDDNKVDRNQTKGE